MRLPGNVGSGEELWNMLIEKRSGMCDVPSDRYNITGFHDQNGTPGTWKMNKGYFLKDVDIRQFDTSFFSMSKADLENLDPQQRQLLEVVYECMDDAGTKSWRGSKIGCYVGVFSDDWRDINSKEIQPRGTSRLLGYDDLAISNRISYEFDLHGPSMTIKTGCSSSLVGLDLACDAIRKGDCTGALVCGSSLIFSPTMTLALSDQGVLSPSGICKTFDAAADGYGRGEAINAVYIKTLSQALHDGDSIRAVIRATSVNCDGRTQGIATPSPEAQEALIRRTYQLAGIRDLSETAIVECHGTGTQVGDPRETLAVGKCFGDKGVIITSVKPNVGHSEGAAGLTSLIKAILAIEHRQVPPNIYFNTPNPNIPFKQYNLQVPLEVQEWPQGRAERVSVNSFGVGGVNSHAIVESLGQYRKCYPDFDQGVAHFNGAKANGNGISVQHDHQGHSSDFIKNGGAHETNGVDCAEASAQSQLLLLSSNSEASLAKTIEAYNEYVMNPTADLKDVAFTLANRRDHMSHRAYAIARAGTPLEASASYSVKSSPTIGWVFTGQGAQWPEMGSELIDCNAVFRKTIKNLDGFLAGLPQPPLWNIEDELRKARGESRVEKAEFGHPLCVAVQIGLVDLLRSWNIQPDFVVGHSSGEISAAYASGALTAEGAMAAAFFRGVTSKGGSSEKRGSMAAIGLGPHEVAPYMEPGVVIACENSQSSVTVSGGSEQVRLVIQNVKEQRPGVLARMLRVEKAFHSHHMLEYGPSYEQALQPYVHSSTPVTSFFSSVTGNKISEKKALGPDYWRQNMENPVLFNRALRSALEGQNDRVLLIEIGPHPALKGPVAQILRDLRRTNDLQLATLHREKDAETSLFHLGGSLFQQDLLRSHSSLCPPGKNVHTLPRHSWKVDTSRLIESRVSKEWRFRNDIPHELLGSRVTEISGELCWRNRLLLQDVPWLLGHEVGGQTLFPGTGYLTMIGEALRQLHRTSSFTLKNVTFKAGLVLEHDKYAELVTILTSPPVESDESLSYTFTISSFDGNRWIKHCFGEAMASVDKSISLDAPQPASLPRKVDADYWYNIIKGVGGNYTGLFRGIRDISVSPNKGLSVVTVPMVEANGNQKYAIHPASLDQCVHCFTVAAYRGLGRNFHNFTVPTFVEEVVISPASNDMTVTVAMRSSGPVSSVCDITAQDEGRVVFSMKGLKTIPINDSSEESNARLVSQIEWRPHADFAKLSELIHHHNDYQKDWETIEELVLLCCFDHLETIKLRNDAPPHYHEFFGWMKDRIDHYMSGFNCFVATDLKLWNLNREQRLARIQQIITLVSTTRLAVAVATIQRVFESAESIFAGDANALNELMTGGILADFYMTVQTLECDQLIRALAHTNPKLRVLEIGAGTGATTVKVLEALISPHGERMYDSYTFTDISAGFFAPAKERFAEFEGIEYASLDITRDPMEQGFNAKGYDLIIAANVVHATPSIQTSLRHVRRLLSPGGKLFLLEIYPETKFINYIMGFLSGWWLGAEDDRADQPIVSPGRWREELMCAGFKEPDIITDDIAPNQLSVGIVASLDVKPDTPSSVTILCYSPEGPYYDAIKTSLESQHTTVETCIFGQPLPSSDIISLLDLQTPVLHELSEESFKILINYVMNFDSRLIWAMPSCQVACDSPSPAMTLGFARTARNELSIKLYTVEIDSDTKLTAAANGLHDILLHARTTELNAQPIDPDWEYAIIDGQIHVPRVHWKTFSAAFSETHRQEERRLKKQLTLEKPGFLRTMGWSEMELQPLQDDQVLIQTKAVGLNFRDVLIALGVLDYNPQDIGLEGCGVVTAIGAGVEDTRIGDRVMYLAPQCFATEITLKESLCVRIHDSMTFEEGAGAPCVYATAVIALIDKANLQQGQTVLIHSACGGVGLAAIQIAQMLEAEVYCTVGNEEKVRYLMDNHNIPLSHIFNSRDSSFLRDVMNATDQKGVDVVLNSLSGDLLHASWKCVSEYGMMIEIGKRDFRRRTKLSLEAFEQNRAFVGLDILPMSRQQPQKVIRILQRCVDWMKTGKLKPGKIAKAWEANEIQDAFRSMQSGRHIGKVVIQMPDDASNLESLKASPLPTIRSDRSYLLVGGLGGLGRTVATWMVEHGARHIIFMSRSAAINAETNDYVEELSSQGCHVQLIQGSVSEISDVERVVRSAAMPIAGVINLTLVLRDAGIGGMSFDDWQQAVAPKVQGTWNLHHAIKDKLDFFILCSSYSAVVGQWGQSNYAAANTFLDAFAQYRHRQGLAASVIDIGVMGDVGVVARNRNALDRFQNSGIFLLKERDLLNAVNLAMQRSAPIPPTQHGAWTSANQIILGLATTVPLSSPQNRVAWKSDIRMSIYHNLSAGTQMSTNATGNAANQDLARGLMNAVASQPEILTEEGTTTIISKALASALCGFLIRDEDDIDVKASAESIGVDSLVAMELRNWVRQNFGVEITVMAIVRSEALLKLGNHIRLKLMERFPLSS
ncbi:Highly reducing polyketide synthase lcsB [Cladobotryum mycophilum]|uniref:Highly reducing polyketide synthase lcsB n=1 Tax=Cladobotryum mycophilum TaxID=491253 RepID=A0ABR0SVK5_9HYPO